MCVEMYVCMCVLVCMCVFVCALPGRYVVIIITSEGAGGVFFFLSFFDGGGDATRGGARQGREGCRRDILPQSFQMFKSFQASWRVY